MHKNTYGAIRLDTVHGYRLDGDNVELNAQVLLAEGASLIDWKLQLWARDVLTDGASTEIKVAEVNLDGAQVDNGVARLETRLDATLPPTGRYYEMALVLAARDGQPPADVASYSDRQWITGPFLQGAAGYCVDAGQVTVRVEQVCNPRGEGNLSGTLALELWAVSEPYVGGVVRGHQLAGLVLGTLAGQSSRNDVNAQLDFTAPPPGHWQVVLMLREWTAAGYVTRDYRAFDAWYRVPAPSADVETSHGALATAAAEALASVEAAVKPTASTSPVGAPGAVVPSGLPPVSTAATVNGTNSPRARVSIQTASVEELAQIKGLTKKVAQEIVRSRPFKSLDELTRVKGIGEKTLRAIRNAIQL